MKKRKAHHGAKRAFKGLKAYQRHLREQVKAGFGHGANGQPTRLNTSEASGASLFYGYKLQRSAA